MAHIILALLALLASPTWDGRFVATYSAVYSAGTVVRSFAVVDVENLGPASSVPVATEAQCDGVAWLRAMHVARERNPTAKTIVWHGWVGRCWQGEKPAKPLGWDAGAKGARW